MTTVFTLKGIEKPVSDEREGNFTDSEPIPENATISRHGFPLSQAEKGIEIPVSDKSEENPTDSEPIPENATISSHGFPLTKEEKGEYHSNNDADKVLHRRKRLEITGQRIIEVLILTDSANMHDDRESLQRYFQIFMNGVNIIYSRIPGLNINFKISEIKVISDDQLHNYVEVQQGCIEVSESIMKTAKLLYSKENLKSYDVALLFTKRDLCSINRKTQKIVHSTTGYAYTDGFCEKFDGPGSLNGERIESGKGLIYSLALMEDDGAYSGVPVTAHEFGHILGLHHTQAEIFDVMSPSTSLGEQAFTWAEFSKKTISDFFTKMEHDSCIYKTSPDALPLLQEYPGQDKDVNAQCQAQRNTEHCEVKDDDVCKKLFCYKKNYATGEGSMECNTIRPAAEGSPCGDGKICLAGKCIENNVELSLRV